ncbi:MAG TPA: cupin domain-containing protein [Candidatus Limnocylindrales bacterium]|nr:cupin domain-containing protein [Candidatus Limnocylindrales bacterium]
MPTAASGAITRYDYGEFSEPPGAAFVVAFDPGARTDWHSHEAGQFIYVLDGRGLIVTRGGDHSTLGAGDLVVVPSDEVHWHGALPDAGLRHVAISIGDSQRQDAVDDETYVAGVRQATWSGPG